MSRRGEVFDNPISGERAIVITDPFDHPDGVLVSELHVQPGGRVVVAHRHPSLVERFHVLRGEVGFLIGEKEHLLGPGGSAEVPTGVLHDWWQVGEEEAVVVVEVDPGVRFVEMVGTFFGLARHGKVDKNGMPRPLQLALSAKDYRDTMIVAKPPPWVQTIIFGVLAPIARARGLKPSYEEYLTSDVVVEPDPAALALIGDDGRLKFERVP
ncbi:MAG TPA: cupin domain-containing protein [Solirubrobacterales bacterium]|nr:cupin domain-containing protein [Solirubrobacterales bacterium]